MKLNPYLTLPGTAAEAIELYKQIFNVEPEISRFSDMPTNISGEEAMVPQSEEAASRILHASFAIGNGMLMISDAPEGQDDSVVMGNQTHVSAHPDSREEADRIFKLLSEGGEVIMPMSDAFWGDYFGMVKDRFGVSWMINYHRDY